MLEWFVREAVVGVWLGGIAWCWNVFVRMILPVALDRCPWAENCEDPP